MTRRQVVLLTLSLGVLAASALATPRLGKAAGKVPRIGLLDYSGPDPARVEWWRALRDALQEMGYVEGRTVAFEARWAEGRLDQLAPLAAELVRLPVDIIVTGGGEAAHAAQQATAAIPIVMASGGDPVQRGLVTSLARPGGNLTGVSSISITLAAKRLELLREFLPKVSRIAILWDGTPNSRMSVDGVEAAARNLRIASRSSPAPDPGQIETAIAQARRDGAGALIVVASPALFLERRRIAELALKQRLPTAVGGKEYAEAGGLFSYAVNYPDLFRRAAAYVDKILRGARPADLPIEQPTKLEMIINLKTAKALNLTIPPAVLARADELIQ